MQSRGDLVYSSQNDDRAQHGIGFPHLLPLCYWYIAEGEQRALEYGTLADVGAQTAAAVTKVSWQYIKVTLNNGVDCISV